MKVLVTGASRGLGRSIILEYARNGHDVIINYNNSYNEAIKLKEEVESIYNVRALVVKADISSEEEIDNLIDIVYKEFGTIDVLVNNAAIAIDNDFILKTKEEFMKVLEVNLVGTYLMSKKIGSRMYQEKKGTIINISSTNGIDTNYIEGIDYDASKAGVISLTHNFAKEFAPYIRVNTVAPGWINTDMNKNLDIEFKKNEEEKILLERFAEPIEIAKVVYFLGSSDASYINDSIIRVDGGVRR